MVKCGKHISTLFNIKSTIFPYYAFINYVFIYSYNNLFPSERFLLLLLHLLLLLLHLLPLLHLLLSIKKKGEDDFTSKVKKKQKRKPFHQNKQTNKESTSGEEQALLSPSPCAHCSPSDWLTCTA